MSTQATEAISAPTEPQQDGLSGSLGREPLSLAQRHDAGAFARRLSDPARQSGSELRASRISDVCVSDHRVAAAAVHRSLHRPPSDAVFAAVRHGLVNGRPAHDRFRAELRHAACRLDAARAWILDLPSGILAHRAPRFRRLAWPRSIPVSGRRQFRLGARPSGRRVHRAAARAERTCLVRARDSGRHHHPDGTRPLVSAQRAREALDRMQRRPATPRSPVGTCQRRWRS